MFSFKTIKGISDLGDVLFGSSFLSYFNVSPKFALQNEKNKFPNLLL